MTSKATYDKVMNYVVTPMTRHYGGTPLNDYQIEAFVEDLGQYSQDSLDRAWREVRKQCKSRPSVAHFISVIQELAPSTKGISNPEQRNDYYSRKNKPLAEKAMRSTIGQLALEHGVGLDVWMTSFRDGRDNLTSSDVMRSKAARQNAADLLAAASKENPFHASLIKMWETMDARERELHAQYYRKQ